jgi:hypothetical protein
MLSPYARNSQKNTYKSKKLCQTFLPKFNYKIHLKNLQQCLSMGLVITKFHRILSFTQSKWLEEYINYNTQMRKNCTTDFEKDFYKLMNNSVFGKLMEDVRRHQKLKLVTDEKYSKKLLSSPLFQRFTIFKENLVAIKMLPKVVVLNKPIYAGFTVLELSKTLM